MAQALRWQVGHLIRAFLLIFTIFYLLFHALSGERGVMAWFRASHELEMLNSELSRVQQERAELEANIGLMRDESLDLDMLEERARETLGYAAPEEAMILVPVNNDR